MFIIIATGGAGVYIIIPAIFTFLVFSFPVEINQTLKLEVIIPPHQGIIFGTRLSLSYKHPHSKEGSTEASSWEQVIIHPYIYIALAGRTTTETAEEIGISLCNVSVLTESAFNEKSWYSECIGYTNICLTRANIKQENIK